MGMRKTAEFKLSSKADQTIGNNFSQIKREYFLNKCFSYEGNFDAPRMTSSHSGTGNLEVTNIAYTI